MRFFQSFASGLSYVGALVAGVILCLMTGLILLEIVLRTFFDTSTFITDEFVGYGVAAMTFIGLGHALDRGELIRVNLLLARLTGRSRRAAELACILLAEAMVLTAIWFFAKTVIRNYERGYVAQTISKIPSWIPESWVLLGLMILALQLLAYLARVATGGPMDEGARHD